jgi:murein DD-endopeptidase MepM/ murein hydrolase activator NlpD
MLLLASALLAQLPLPRSSSRAAELAALIPLLEENAIGLPHFPLKGRAFISSGFGFRDHPLLSAPRFHGGWDLPQRSGTPVYACRSGRVVYSGWISGYGETVQVLHPDGRSSLYGHLRSRAVRVGDWAVGGDTLLGQVGSTGLSTGPHLHFEVRDTEGRPLNPLGWLGRAALGPLRRTR